MLALQRANVPVEEYIAYEIEPSAINISLKNYPDIKQCGDVCTADFSKYIRIDLHIGGSPCVDLSNYKFYRNDVKGLDGDKSSLFYHYVRAFREVNPKWFLLENVAVMQNKWRDIISEELGVLPIEINSADFSAQERPRYYWTNIPVSVYPKKNILLKDIVESAESVPAKYWYNRDFIYNGPDKKVACTLLHRY